MNNTQFNAELFNSDHQFLTSSETYPISFNWYNLMSLCSSTTWVIIQKLNAFDINNVDLVSFISSLSDWGWVINKKYSNKNLSMSIFIQWTSYSDLVSRIDELKKNLQYVESFLDITINWEIRRYTATVSSITVPSFNKLQDYIEWIEVEFLITSPHWIKVTENQVTMNAMTSDFSKLVDNQWTYKVYPIVKIITNSGSTLTWIWITHKKVWETVWYTVSISETILPNSVVIFDYIQKIITINDVEVNFSWIMMPMEVWQSVFSFDFTWTINVNTYIIHNPTFV